MSHALIRKIDAWRFERPLALLLGIAAMFALGAMPPALLGPLASPALHIGLAAAAGLVLGGLAFLAMRKPRPKADPDLDPIDEEPETPVPVERLVRLRRADAHPDAPPRQPIHAIRDLGEPFMDIGAFAPPPPEPSPGDAIPHGHFSEVEAAPASAAPDAEPADADVDSTAPITIAEPEAVVAMPAEELSEPAEPAPVADAPAPRQSRASLTELMDRLSAGVERRAGEPPRPPAAHPQLREALDELNWLAARRG